MPAGAACTLFQANVSGNVQVSQNASLTVDGLEEWSSIGGNIQANNCAFALLEGSVTVGGNVQIQNCKGTSGFTGPGIKIHGNFQCQDNQGACEATLGEVGGNAQIQNNSAAKAGDISLDVIVGNLQCQQNTPAPTHALGGEWVSGNLQGQCAAQLGFAAASLPVREPGRAIAAGHDDHGRRGLSGWHAHPGIFGRGAQRRRHHRCGLALPGGR